MLHKWKIPEAIGNMSSNHLYGESLKKNDTSELTYKTETDPQS